MTRHFLEVIFVHGDFRFTGRDVVEDALDEALVAAGIGEVTGGGAGRNGCNIDVEVTDVARGLAVVREVLKTLGVASSTTISHNQGDFLAGAGSRTAYGVYE